MWGGIYRHSAYLLIPLESENCLVAFDILRSYRDYAAHPRDGEVPRHIIMCNLNAFPLFCQRVYQAIEWLGVNGV